MVGLFAVVGLTIEPRPVVHTSHPTYGYLLKAGHFKIVWAPEFLEWPEWASAADLMFAEAAGWRRQIRFAHGTGGHAAALPTLRIFRDRTDAGAQLAQRLEMYRAEDPLILGIPRGGVPVAAERRASAEIDPRHLFPGSIKSLAVNVLRVLRQMAPDSDRQGFATAVWHGSDLERI